MTGGLQALRAGGQRIITRSEEETESLGQELAGYGELEALALCGDLGAGKTALVRGLARGLGAGGVVQSPTFVLARRYDGRRPLWHFDFYRLEKDSVLEALDWPPRDPGAGVAAEWADRFPEVFPPGTLWVRMTLKDRECREVSFSGGPGEGTR